MHPLLQWAELHEQPIPQFSRLWEKLAWGMLEESKAQGAAYSPLRPACHVAEGGAGMRGTGPVLWGRQRCLVEDPTVMGPRRLGQMQGRKGKNTGGVFAALRWGCF